MKYFHTAISVNNMEESQRFYEEVFDLKVESKVELSDLKTKITNLKSKEGSTIELFQHESPIPLNENLMDFQKVGIKHIAFTVDNIEETMQKALSNGSKIIWPIRNGISIKRLAFISDPNGIPIELVELKN